MSCTNHELYCFKNHSINYFIKVFKEKSALPSIVRPSDYDFFRKLYEILF